MASKAEPPRRRQLFSPEVEAALREAREASLAAAENTKKSARVGEAEQISGEVGAVSVWVANPSVRLRTALKKLDEIKNFDRHGWPIRSLPGLVGQNLLEQTAGCEAAMRVLRERLPGEGEFYCKVWEN